MPESPPEETTGSLESITRGASVFFLGRVLAKGLKFLLNILLTRGLGASLFGIYAFAKTLVSIFVVLARVGTGKSVLRYVPSYEDNPERRNKIVGLAYLTVLVGSVLVSGTLFVSAPTITTLTLDNPLLVDVLRVFALILPFNAVIQLTNAVFRSLEELEYQVLISDIAEPIAQLVVVAVALFVGYSLLGVVAGLAIAAVLVCSLAVSLLYVRTDIRPNMITRRSRQNTFEFYNYSAPLTLKDLGSILYTRIDILMVGFFLVESAVGIYQVAILVAGLLALPLNGFNQLFPPIASRLYTNGDIDELESIYRTTTRWTLTATIPPALVMFLYSSELLSIFGPEFPTGTVVLGLFTVGQLTNSAVGSSGFLLMMTGHQYLNLLNQWTLGVLNVILNYVFILEFGFVGAAVATAGTLAFINILRVVEVWYTEQLTPYSKQFWKPVVAGVIAGGFMYLLQMFVGGHLLLIGGSILGGLLFSLLLFSFGIEKDDKEFFNDVILPKIS